VQLVTVIEPPPPSVSRHLNPQFHEHETVAHRTGDVKKHLTTVAEGLQAEGLSASFDTPSGTPLAR